jgi:predicted DNA-binding transcriptional regulator YafY
MPIAADPTLPQAQHDRMLGIVAVIAQQPGIGTEELADALADQAGKRWGKATLFADLKRLKSAGILADQRHRKGYFLTGPTVAPEDMRALMNGLRIQAEDLENPIAKRLYEQQLARFARTRDDEAYFGYPVEALGNRPVTRGAGGELAQAMEALRDPILRGQRVRVRLVRDNWHKHKGPRNHDVFPLQFVFHDVAWYLLCENAETRQFFTLRLDRLSPVVTPIGKSARGARLQAERLELAKGLMAQSWGICLPPHDAEGALAAPLVTARVWFHPDKSGFIEEANRRHPAQAVTRRPDGAIFEVALPDHPSVWLFFKVWVLGWGAAAEVLEPAALRQAIADELAEQHQRYQRPLS